MKLIVHGQIGVYDVTIARGSYDIVDQSTKPARKWDTQAVGLTSETAAKLAIAAIESVDGPVEVQCDVPEFLKRINVGQ